MTKKSILRPLCGAALVAAAALFAGCSDVYTGGDADSTTVSFAGAEAQYTQPNATGKLTSIVTDIYYSSIGQAAEDSTVTLTFYAKTRLDEESIKQAVAFYALTENEISVGTGKIRAYPKRTEQLPSSLLVYGEPDIYSGYVTGKARFRVDTSKVDNGLIAVMVDAAKLKDKRGNFVLNGDGNETAGEESDSWIDYIRVENDKNGVYITSDKRLQYSSNYKEKFAPQYTYWDDLEELKGFSESKYANGEFTLRIDAPYNNYILDDNIYNLHYRENLAATLKNIYSVQVKAAGETSWGAEQPLTFEYKSDRYQYVATTPQIPVGAKFRIVIKTITKDALPADTDAEKLYGHAAYASYKKNSYTDYYEYDDYDNFYYYFETEPSYIVQEANDTDDFEAGDYYSYRNITSAQQSFFDKWERIGKNKWLVSLEEEILYDIGDDDKLYPRFEKIDGFKVVLNKDSGDSYTELNATITKIDDRTVLIELPSYYTNGTIELWVGSDTTITGNTLHPTQKTFGSFVDVSKGVVSGYVKITDLSTYDTSGSIGSNDSSDVVGGGSTGGGTEEEEPEPSDDVDLADSSWSSVDREVEIFFEEASKYFIFYNYDGGATSLGPLYYMVSGDLVILYDTRDGTLYGDVSGDCMTLYRYENGEYYHYLTLWKE